MAMPRRTTRQIQVGSVPVGGGAPITVQSMTITKTADVEGTLAQIYGLAADYREEISEAKGVQLKAFARGQDASAATRKLLDLADRNLADVHAYLDGNAELLAQIGMPKQPLLELVHYMLDRFVSQPGAEPPALPPPEVLQRFPVAVRRLILPDEGGG